MALVFHHTNFAQDRLSLTQKIIMVFSIYPNHMMGQKATLQDIIPIFPTFGFPSSLPSLALSLFLLPLTQVLRAPAQEG